MNIALPRGFLFSGIHSGIKKRGLDLGLIYSCLSTNTWCLFTNNRIKSYSLKVSSRNLRKTSNIRAILVNSGVANTCCGLHTLKETTALVRDLSSFLSLRANQILVFSTGRIGKRLDFLRIKAKFQSLLRNLSTANFMDFARAILTTDTRCKLRSFRMKTPRGVINTLGIAKGAGMIYPHFNTLLCFFLSDAFIERGLLREMLDELNFSSFSRINIDGSTSTNDALVMVANGASRIDLKSNRSFKRIFRRKLMDLGLSLSQDLVRDAEGATKFITIRVRGLKFRTARTIFENISNSLLFKSCLYGCSPNWGRVLQSIGQAGINLDERKITLFYISSKGKVCVFRKGNPLNKEKEAQEILTDKDIIIEVGVDSRLKEVYDFYTCDLSTEYIKINAH